MGFDIDVGLFLCLDDESGAAWSREERERFLDGINAALRRLEQPGHREPRTVADVDPPLGQDVDPRGFGASMGSYSSHARTVDRLDWFARHVAVRGYPPSADPPYGGELYHGYDTLADRRLTFDHLLTACGDQVVLLPRPLDRILVDVDGPWWFVSAQRLRAEATALGFVLRFADPEVSRSAVVDWITGTPVEDPSFAGLDARLPDDVDAVQAWAHEALLCHRLLQCADDVLRTGAMGLTG